MMEYPGPPPPQPLYATRIADRRPLFKYHTNIGKAKNAVGYTMYGFKCRGGVIYKWNIEKAGWEVVFEVQPGSDPNDLPWRS